MLEFRFFLCCLKHIAILTAPLSCTARATIAVNALTVLTAERARRSSISVHRVAETETTTFMDCVNCLIAFTNNPHR
jgi:hypothetical protein